MMSASSEEQLQNDNLHRSTDNDIEVDDDVEDDDDRNVSATMKHLGNRNNLSGSYSNLFRADKTDDESGEVVQRRQTQVETELMGGGMLRENVYSNVPFGSGAELASSTLMQQSVEGNREPTIDPSLHVYSNVPSTVTGKGSSLHDISFGGVSGIFEANTTSQSVAESLLQMRRFSGEGQSSSTLMADDLDLDDAVMGAGAFGQNHHKVMADSKSTAGQPPFSPKKITTASIELTNVIPQVRKLLP